MLNNGSVRETQVRGSGTEDQSRISAGNTEAIPTEEPVSVEENAASDLQNNTNSDDSQGVITSQPESSSGANTSSDNGSDKTDDQSVIPSETVVNNGGLYVQYRGDVYYRQYNAASYQSTGLWGYYNAVPGVTKNMMRLNADGTSEVVFSDDGEGAIYISNDRMYLQKPYGYDAIIYSVGLDGSNKKQYGMGTFKGIDETTGTIICMLSELDDTKSLSVINKITGEVNRLSLSVPCEEILAVRDGFIYYRGIVDYKESSLGKIKLCKVAVDGTGEILLAETGTDLYEYETFGTLIPCLQFVGETIYFSYGGYAGSEYFYQGGQIARVNKDGSDFKILAGSADDNDDSLSDFIDADFYVTTVNGNDTLYFSSGYEETKHRIKSLNISTGQIDITDFYISPEGIPFEYNGGVSIYQNASPDRKTLIQEIDYSSLDLSDSADYSYKIHDIEICGSWVFYKLEANEDDPAASMGWRDGYRRINTQVIRETIGGGAKDILFEY